MKISDTFRSWSPALMMAAFSMQFVTSCKRPHLEDSRPSPDSQKIESKRAMAPTLAFDSPLVLKLTETSDPEERSKIVVELGEQKVAEAVPYLVANITAIKSSHVYNAMDWNNGYPCSTALTQIGDVAVPHIQDQFTVAVSKVDQLILLHTLIRIKGAQFVVDWLETLKPSNQKNMSEDRLNELKKWVQSQVPESQVSTRHPTN